MAEDVNERERLQRLVGYVSKKFTQLQFHGGGAEGITIALASKALLSSILAQARAIDLLNATRAAVVREVERIEGWAGPLSRAFRMFSWDTHSVMATLRDIRVTEVDGGLLSAHAHWQSAEEAADLNAAVAANGLSLAWRSVAEEFGVSP